jgi:signal transduction histidine kinase
LDESPPSPSWSHDWLQLSHELRTPLNAILGNIELLLDGSAGPLAAPARACIGDIQTASRQLLHQLQPLLLLIQARTSGALATRMPLDLLALIRQASADARTDQDASRRPDVQPARRPERPSGAACLPEPASLMVLGDPVWLGALAAALVDLHATAQDAGGPLSITLEPPAPGADGVVLRAAWPGLDPATTSPVPLALIDAVLALHGGRIRAFRGDGLRLDLPGAVSATDGGAEHHCR